MRSDGVKTLLLLAASLILTLLVLEIGLRSYGYEWLHLNRLRTEREMVLRRSPNQDMRYELTPGASGRAWGATVAINSLGYRGYEGVPGRHSGYRIVVLGDSIAFGIKLPVEATFAHQLHRLLLAEAQDSEVLNLAVPGYDSIQDVALLEFRGLDYRPDLVVVAYCLNDAGVVSAELQYLERWSVLYRSRLAQFVAERISRLRHYNWRRHKNTLEVFRREYEGQIDEIGPDEGELRALMASVPEPHPSRWYGHPDRVGRIRYAFRRLGHLAVENGFSVVIVVLPWLTGDSHTYPHRSAHRIIEMESRRAGFDTIDLTDEFMRAGVENLKIARRDHVHPNKAGHTIIAQRLLEYVRTQARTQAQ